jgi:mRNA interferase YafQ
MTRKIEITKKFKQDYKRESKGHHRKTLEYDLKKVLTALSNDKPLDSKNRDHALTGNWKDHRDCHIKPDLVLIYRKPDKNRLQLIRLGSHSQISL